MFIVVDNQLDTIIDLFETIEAACHYLRDYGIESENDNFTVYECKKIGTIKPAIKMEYFAD